MNAKGKVSGGLLAILAIALVVGGLVYTGVLQLPGEAPAAVVMPQKVGIQCASNTTPELKFVALDKINQATSRSDDTNVVVFLNGVFNKEYRLNDDSTADVSPGDGYTLYAKGATSDTTQFGQIITGNAACEELQTKNFYLPKIGTATFSFYNTDDDALNSASDIQAVGSGEKINVDFRIKETTADQCLGTEYSDKDLALCFDYNSDCWKKPIFKVGGVTAPTLGTPEGHTAIMSVVTPDSTACYTIPGLKEICDYDEVGDAESFSVEVEAKASVNPFANNDINAWLYMPQIHQDSETGLYDWYYSKPSDANILVYPRPGNLYIN